jgi:CheY-like chemotaxis protein
LDTSERRDLNEHELSRKRQTEIQVRVLIVDDYENSRDLTEAAFVTAGYSDVCVAGSAREAFKMMDIGWPSSKDGAQVDLVLLDIAMSGMDGIEACARIRCDSRYADTPIIMLTAIDDLDSLTNAFVAGASDYITKPIDRVELLERVQATLKLKQKTNWRLFGGE